jgi:FkbM family methyltransferase
MNIKKNKIIRAFLFPVLLLKNLILRNKNQKIVRFNDIFSNVIEGSLIVKLDSIPGCFEIDARSHLLQRILINNDYEPEIVALITENVNPQKDAINVGANIGLFAVLLSNLINSNRKVLAIEPTPLAFKYLNNNLERNNKKENIQVYNGICTNVSNEYTMNTILGKEEYSSLGESIHISNIKEEIVKIQVQGETLDNLVLKFNLLPGLLLIDVEGAEMKVLEGSSKLLKELKPVIISELDDALLSKQDTSSKKVIAFLETLGYNVSNIDNTKINYPFNGNIIAKPKN